MSIHEDYKVLDTSLIVKSRKKNQNRFEDWDNERPNKNERKTLRKECGESCFIIPDYGPDGNLFPICPKFRKTQGTCKYSCSLLEYTNQKAKQDKRKKVIHVSTELLRKLKCIPPLEDQEGSQEEEERVETTPEKKKNRDQVPI